MVDSLSCLLCVVFILASVVLSLLILAGIWWRESSGQWQLQVVVLGDAGRSPRMQYHCLSLVQLNYNVDLIAYGGSPLINGLRKNQRLTHHVLSEPPSFLRGLPTILRYILKVIYQTADLFWVILLHTKKPSHVLMQNPPAIPVLFVMVVVCLLRGSKLIVDYHNYGHTILALSLGKEHPLVQFSKVYERLLCGFAHANLCVSQAMKKDLARTLGIGKLVAEVKVAFDSEKLISSGISSLSYTKTSAIILYDRPPKMFHPTSVEKQHKLFQKLAETEPAFRAPPSANAYDQLKSVTLFTECTHEGKVSLRKERPFLIISSTSWTEDEDFGILLQALEVYDEKVSKKEADGLPKIMCVITGKGPLKEHYEEIIAQKNLSHVTIHTLWLSAEDYPLLLGSADLGICLHKSSSGLDLPMKVVDMFGSGLPVCAVNFNCLHELLRHEHNGLIFNDHKELADQLQVLSQGFPSRMKNYYLQRFRDNLSSFQSLRWHHYWKLHVLPIISPPQ